MSRKDRKKKERKEKEKRKKEREIESSTTHQANNIQNSI